VVIAAAAVAALSMHPATAAASGEPPGLSASDPEAWGRHSTRSLHLGRAGWGLVGTGIAFTLAGAAMNTVQAVIPVDPSYDEQGPPMYLLIGIPLFCNAAVLYGIGFGLLGSGWLEAARARKLAAGDLSKASKKRRSPDPRKLTMAGMALSGASLGLLAGAWVGWSVDAARGFEVDAGWVSYLTLYPLAMTSLGLGTPLVLVPGARTRQDRGLSGRNGLNVSGWVFYALALATVPVYWAFRIPYIGIAGSAFLVTGASLTLAAGAGRLDDPSAGEASTVSIAPFASPVPGGAIAGLAGTF
jgi:hypothetical protein